MAENNDLPIVVTHLLKGVLYRDTHERQWNQLLNLRSQVSDYVGVIGLRAIIDEAEGYAFLRSIDAEDGEDALPRLVARRSLSFQVSLLLALLRKKLAELDAASADTRLVLTRQQIIDMMLVFLPESSNSARLFDQVDSYINKTVDLGFLRRMPTHPDHYEVRRIIKAFVDGQWLAELDQRLDDYRRHLHTEGAPA